MVPPPRRRLRDAFGARDDIRSEITNPWEPYEREWRSIRGGGHEPRPAPTHPGCAKRFVAYPRRPPPEVVVAMSGVGLAALAPGLRGLVIGLAVVIAIGRSGFPYRSNPARPVVTEAALIIGGLWSGDAVRGSDAAGCRPRGVGVLSGAEPFLSGSRRALHRG